MMLSHVRRRATLGALVAIGTYGSSALGSGGPRAYFEPTDLAVEDPGVVALDMQAAVMRTPTHRTAWLWDSEMDVGVSRAVELGVETAVRLDGPAAKPQEYDPAAFDHLWLTSKLRLFDLGGELDTFAFGAQLGPKLPASPGSVGAGFETILVAEWIHDKRRHVYVNLGGFVDPGRALSHDRPTALEYGVTVDQDLDEHDVLSILAALGSVHFFSTDYDQTCITGGLAWSPAKALTLSAVVFGGVQGTDPGGVLLGIVPRFAVW